MFLSAQGTAPSPSSQAPCGAQFFAVTPTLSSCQMMHCRPAELICTKTSSGLCHAAYLRGTLILNELQESQKPNPDTFHQDIARVFQRIHLGMCDSGASADRRQRDAERSRDDVCFCLIPSTFIKSLRHFWPRTRL